MNVFDLVATLTLDTGDYESKLSATAGKTDGFGSKLGSALGTATKVVAGAVATAGAGLVAFGKAAWDTGAQFDTSMSQVAATMGMTNEEFKSLEVATDSFQGTLEGLAKEMGANTQFTATQAGDALNYLALAGYSAQESAQTLPTILNLAAAGAMDLGSASDMVTDSMSAFGLGVDYADTMVDKMAKTASKSNTSVAQLGEAYLTVGANAKSMSGAVYTMADGSTRATDKTTELSTALGILANNGIKGSEGGTKLRNVLMSLQSPTDNAAEALESLNVDVFDSQGNMRDLNSILGDLNSSMDGMTDQKKANIISTIFNKADIAAVNALLDNSGEAWQDLAVAIEESGGAAQQMADTQMDNLQGKMTLLGSGLDGLKLAFYDTFSNTAKGAVDTVTGYVNRLTKAMQDGGLEGFIDELGDVLTDGVAEITKAAPKFLASAGKLALSIASGFVSNVPTVLSSLYDTGMEMMSSISSGLSDNVSSLLDQALPMMVDFSASIREGASNLVDSGLEIITQLGMGIINSIPTLIETVPQIITNIAGIINDNAPKILEAGFKLLVELGKGLINAIPTLIANIPQIIEAVVSVFTAFNWTSLGKNIITLLKNGISSMIGAVGSAGQGVFNAIRNALVNLPSTLMNIGTNAISFFKSVFTGGISALGSIANQIVTAIVNAITGLPARLLSIATNAISGVKNAFTGGGWSSVGSNIISGIASGISAGVGSIISAARSAASSALAAAKSFLGIASPSKVMRDVIGKNMMLGWAEGMDDNVDEVLGSTKDAVGDVMSAFKDHDDMTADFSINAKANVTTRALSVPEREQIASVVRETLRSVEDMVLYNNITLNMDSERVSTKLTNSVVKRISKTQASSMRAMGVV